MSPKQLHRARWTPLIDKSLLFRTLIRNHVGMATLITAQKDRACGGFQSHLKFSEPSKVR